MKMTVREEVYTLDDTRSEHNMDIELRGNRRRG